MELREKIMLWLVIPFLFAVSAWKWRQTHFEVLQLQREMHLQSIWNADHNRRLHSE